MLCLHKIQDLVSGLKQCVHCQDLYVDDRAVCFAAIPELDHHGNIQRIHESSPTFDINDWIIRDYLECKSWQDVFMKIWGYSSTFTCVACNRIFDLMHLRTCSTNDGYSQSDEFLEFCPFETDLSQQDHHAQQLDPSLFDSFSRFKDTVPKIKYSLEVPKVKSNPKISKSKLNGYQTKPYIQRDLDQDQIRQWIQELRL
jgi:hypothetical protein